MNHLRIALVVMASACHPEICSTLVAADGQTSRGAQIYAEKCASCHGANGEGTADNYPETLCGDKPTIDLANVISTTMPEGEPELCAGDEAKIVAEWMQKAFYSPEAQARINPPRQKLSRLTVSQYRNAIADLVEGFTWVRSPDDKRGLKSQYYKSRGFSGKHRVIERVDPVIDFDFGEGTPDKDKIPDNKEFSLRSQGSLLVDETGWYDFILKTENGGRLFVNDDETPIIDAWVKSGNETEYRGSRFLLAGRLYPIAIEWFTFKEKTASVRLWWKPPLSIDQPIPERHLYPDSSPNVLVVETPFPPDDRSDGYIRGTLVSREWDDATTFAAIEVADKLKPFLREIAKLKKDDNEQQRREKLQNFCRDLAYRAFRRPLDDVQSTTYIDNHFQPGVPTDDAVRRSVLAILKSPRFLYREVTGDYDLYSKASRLSFALYDSIPSPGLLQAAEKQWINSDKALSDQAWKMINSWRGRVRLQEFLRVWMNLERLEDLSKDDELFADFTPEVVADLRTSFELLLEECVNDDKHGFQKLLTSDHIWMNDRLAKFYGTQPQDGNKFEKVKFEPDRRAGAVSHPFLLAGLAYQKTSSPIHRGVFLSRGILGRALKPPPDSVSPAAPDLDPKLTTRQRVQKQTSPAMCNTCHKMINSLGFALEGFDAVGRSRTKEKQNPIDATGSYRLRTGETVNFAGANELAKFLLENQETRRSFTRQLFHHTVQQPILAYGSQSIEELATSFEQQNLNMKHLLAEIAIRSASFSPTNTPASQTAQVTLPSK